MTNRNGGMLQRRCIASRPDPEVPMGAIECRYVATARTIRHPAFGIAVKESEPTGSNRPNVDIPQSVQALASRCTGLSLLAVRQDDRF